MTNSVVKYFEYKNMNEQREQLSRLMDEYRNTEQDQSVLNDVLKDVNQQYAMHRYQMIGEVMRNELPESIKLDFSAEVMSQIEREPALHMQHSAQPKAEHEHQTSWFWSVLFKPVAGLAVAATVAVVAVSNLQIQSTSVEQADQLASADSSSAEVERLASISLADRGLSKVSANGQNSAASVGMNWKIKRDQPDIQNKLNAYLVNHNEFSNSWQGIIPQVRVVGFDVQK